jgi:hypothetical protein
VTATVDRDPHSLHAARRACWRFLRTGCAADLHEVRAVIEAAARLDPVLAVAAEAMYRHLDSNDVVPYVEWVALVLDGLHGPTVAAALAPGDGPGGTVSVTVLG